MAWNGSDRSDSLTVPRKPDTSGERQRPIVLMIVCGMVLLGIVTTLILTRGEEPVERSESPAKATIITNQTKSVKAEKPVQTNVVVKKALSPAWQKFYDGRDTNKWIVIVDPRTGEERLNRRVRPRRRDARPPLYKSHALNVLDAIAFNPIKTSMSGLRIDGRFKESFQEGIVERIEVLATDSEEIRARKKGMIELRKELIARVKDGEEINKIVSDAIKDRNYVAAYRRQMMTEYGRMKREGDDPELTEAFGNKCNEILEEKGAAPLLTEKVMDRIIAERNLNQSN